MVDTQHLKCCEQLLVWVRVPPLVRLENGGLAQLARASALHAEGHRFDSDILHIVTIRKNGGTDAKYEMETFETRIKEWMRYKPHSRYNLIKKNK